jgi:hypothetical protein
MKIFSLVLLVIVLSNCASVVTGGGWKDVSISSYPPNARFRIIDEKGKQIVTGTTPQTVPLKGGKPYFAQKRYVVQYNLEGYQGANSVIGSEFNAWYCANACIGGIIGWLIVDPLTGAMYKVDRKEVHVTLIPYTPYKEIETVINPVIVEDTTVQIKTLVQDSTRLIDNQNALKKDTVLPKKPSTTEFDYYPNPKPSKRDSL